ncbi:hypothetical protein [Mycolicibacterium sp.]|uniref:phosphotransferase-like protein n=1 Tax=Mycolicibacterium sp. TaxID=2320850 RepID=UPI0037CC0965
MRRGGWVDLLTVMADVDVVIVGVHCDAAVLMDREAARGDRVAGMAAAQIEVTHNHGLV